MLYPKPLGVTTNFYAKCDTCGTEIQDPLNEELTIAAVILTEKYGWILMEDFETCYCSVACCDKDDIENISERIKEYNDGDERRALN